MQNLCHLDARAFDKRVSVDTQAAATGVKLVDPRSRKWGRVGQRLHYLDTRSPCTMSNPFPSGCRSTYVLVAAPLKTSSPLRSRLTAIVRRRPCSGVMPTILTTWPVAWIVTRWFLRGVQRGQLRKVGSAGRRTHEWIQRSRYESVNSSKPEERNWSHMPSKRARMSARSRSCVKGASVVPRWAL